MRKFAFVVLGWITLFLGSQLLIKLVEPYDYSDSTLGQLFLVYFFIFLTLFIFLYRRVFPKPHLKQSSGTGFTYRPPTKSAGDQAPLLEASVKFRWSNGFVYREPSEGTIKLFYNKLNNSIMFDWTLQSRTLRQRVGETVNSANLNIVESTDGVITIEYPNPDHSTTTLEILPFSEFDHSRIAAALKDS
jgi:hypothetical protein